MRVKQLELIAVRDMGSACEVNFAEDELVGLHTGDM